METKYESLKETIETKANELSQAVESFRSEMKVLLEEEKNNEIIKVLNSLNARLSSIEARLIASEEDE